MKAHTFHADRPRVAIGYIRVSTLEQAQEGVSLDAQRDKLKLYCRSTGIRLSQIFADEGVSGGTMERPGLHAALRTLQSGRANTLVVVKLDRLTRSVKDLCILVDEYFAKERYDLISVCGMINTHTAAGRLMMLNLANYAQYERELISERTREAMQHMRSQGIRLGVAPYGYSHSTQLDDKGRRVLKRVVTEQAVIEQIAAWHRQGHQLKVIASMLDKQGIRPRRGAAWVPTVISRILEREGHHKRQRFHKTPTPPRMYDKDRAAERAHQLRDEGLSLRAIGRRLSKEGLITARGGEWHAASVAELLTHWREASPTSAAQRAATLRAQGHSLREIARLLNHEGHRLPRGGRWVAASVHTLLKQPSEQQIARTDGDGSFPPSASLA